MYMNSTPTAAANARGSVSSPVGIMNAAPASASPGTVGRFGTRKKRSHGLSFKENTRISIPYPLRVWRHHIKLRASTSKAMRSASGGGRSARSHLTASTAAFAVGVRSTTW